MRTRTRDPRRHALFVFCLTLSHLAANQVVAEDVPSATDFEPKLLIAFSAYHPRPKHPTVYFYHHDGESRGKIVGSIDVSGKRADYHASLSHDGRWCAFASEVENQTSKVLLWDVPGKKLVELPGVNETPHAQLYPSISGDGKLIALAAWSHPQGQGRWDVLGYDVVGKKRLPLPGLNTTP